MFLTLKQRKAVRLITGCAALYGTISFLYCLILYTEVNTNAIILTLCTLYLFYGSSLKPEKAE
jgi:hypothetical protein